MSQEEIITYETLTRKRDENHGNLPLMEAFRLGLLERKKEIEANDWKVQKDGTMLHEDPYYCIEGYRLAENWLEHMKGKRWVNMSTFVDAYIRACYAAGVKNVQITY